MPKSVVAIGSASAEGLRDSKRRETRERIAQTGLSLFLKNGYADTTLDAIAVEAGISRRSFFAYFKSKDDIVIFWQEAGWNSLIADLLKISPDVRPLDAVRDLMLRQMERYSTEELKSLDRLIRSSDSLMARKNTFYAEQELALFSALCEVWRQPERRTALRMVAIVAVGATRMTTQAWGQQSGQTRPMADLLRDAFDSLESEIGVGS